MADMAFTVELAHLHPEGERIRITDEDNGESITLDFPDAVMLREFISAVLDRVDAFQAGGGNA